MKGLFEELRRRHVYRAAVVYIVVAWLLLQVTDIVFGIVQAPEWVMQAVLALLVLGFPIAVALAWAFEITPEGVRRTEPIDSPGARQPEDRRRVGHRLNIILGTSLLAALGVIAWQHASPPSAGDQAPIVDDAEPAVAAPAADIPFASIAVLPLTNASGDAGQDFFADGLTEELIAGLSKLEELKVIGRSSSARFKGSTESSDAIGRQLGVAHLLEGSVRRQDDAVRISVNLLAAQDGRSLWSQSFDRRLSDIFAVQGEIAQAVATALRVQLVDVGRLQEWPPSGNVEAYLMMLQARAKHRSSTTAELVESIPLMEKAIALDPKYAYAHAGLALNNLNLFNRTVDDPVAEARYRANALAAFDRAHALAPTAPVVMLTQAHLLSALGRDEDGALRVAQDALALYPNDPLALSAMFTQMTARGRFEEALSFARKLVAIDPMRAYYLSSLSSSLIALGRYDDARQVLRRLLSLEPGYPGIHSSLAAIEILGGHPERAAAHAERETSERGRQATVALAHAANGRREQAMVEVANLDRTCNGHCYPVHALVHSLLGEDALMYDALEKALARAQADSYALGLLDDFYLRRHWDDPRFRDLAERNGTPVPEGANDAGTGNAIPIGSQAP